MYRIGVDLGGTNIAVGLVNEENEIVCRTTAPTRAALGAETVIGALFSPRYRATAGNLPSRTGQRCWHHRCGSTCRCLM